MVAEGGGRHYSAAARFASWLPNRPPTRKSKPCFVSFEAQACAFWCALDEENRSPSKTGRDYAYLHQGSFLLQDDAAHQGQCGRGRHGRADSADSAKGLEQRVGVHARGASPGSFGFVDELDDASVARCIDGVGLREADDFPVEEIDLG